jgi:hypothetical protein
VLAPGRAEGRKKEHSGALGPPSDDLVRTLQTDEDYDRPLAVQIAALLHVAGVDVGEDRRGMASLLDRVWALNISTGTTHWEFASNRTGRRR